MASLSCDAANEENELVAMAQVFRSDGLTVFTVSGIYETDEECQASFQSFAEGFKEAAEEPGLTATFVTKTCAATVLMAAEFDALWNGTPRPTMLLFTNLQSLGRVE